MNHKILFCSFLVIVAIGCSQVTVEPTSTSIKIPPTETVTPIPPSATYTETNTLKPSPTFTNTPTSTNTPIPPTNTSTYTPIPQPIEGDWKGVTEDGFSISFTIEEEDMKLFLRDLRLKVEFSCNAAIQTVLITSFSSYEKQQIIKGGFKHSNKSLSINGDVLSPEEMEGNFTLNFSEACEFTQNWTVSLKSE